MALLIYDHVLMFCGSCFLLDFDCYNQYGKCFLVCIVFKVMEFVLTIRWIMAHRIISINYKLEWTLEI